MYHSVTFGDKNTWDDWHLVPSSRPLFLPPEVKTKYVDIPGSNGHLDLTEALTGETLYENRTGDIEFYVMNGYQEWEEAYSNIMNYLHGQEMKAYLEDDPGFYYIGRFFVNSWASDKDYSRITISYNVYPYKIDFFSSAEDWLWDPFNFGSGIIRDYSNIRIDGENTFQIYGSKMTVVPTFIAILDNPNSPILLSVEGQSEVNFMLYNGSNKFPDVKIQDGITSLIFKGKGIVTIDYRGGSL